jgi:hypothetical protein
VFHRTVHTVPLLSKPRECLYNGLDWIGLDWIGLDWIGLDWIGLDWIGLDWIGLGQPSLVIVSELQKGPHP